MCFVPGGLFDLRVAQLLDSACFHPDRNVAG
jgi:hypothetical protein